MATQTGSLDLRAVKQTYIKTVAKAQPIYKRTNSSSAPTAPTSKITVSTDQTTTGNWTTMHMSRIYASNTAYKYLWTCNQFLAPDGTFLGCSEVVADEGTTVIDGANIVTGSVTAEKIKGETLTLNKFTSSAQSEILNSNVEIGGRNLAQGTSSEWTNWFTPVAEATNQVFLVGNAYLPDNKSAGDKYACAYEIEFSGVTSGSSGDFRFVPQGSVDDVWTLVNVWGISSKAAFKEYGVMTSPPDDGIYRYEGVATLEEVSVNATKFQLGFRADRWGSGKYRVRNVKVEKGNKTTDWSPAPEDVQAEIDSKKSVHTLTSTNVSGYTYSQILTWSAEGYGGTTGSSWGVTSTAGVKAGDTVRIAFPVSDMNLEKVYVVGTVVSVTNNNFLKMTSHGLDTTIIDGGKILTNSIGANQIKANAITIGKIANDTQSQILNSNVESYDIEPSYPYVEMDTNGSDPTAITVSAKYTKGSNAPTAYSGRFKIETSEDNTNWTTTYTSSANESSTTITTPTAVEDKVLYTFRASPAGGLVDERAIVGGTIAWNQLVQNGNFASTSGWSSTNSTMSVSSNECSFTASAQYGRVSTYTPTVNNHIYLATAQIKANSTLVSIQWWTKSTLVSTTGAFSSVAVIDRVAYSGTQVNYPRIIDSRTSGWDAVQVKNINVFDLTQMFGSTIADYIYSLETATAGAGVAFFKNLFPKPYYEYNAGELLSVSAVEKRTVGKNLIPRPFSDTIKTTNGITYTDNGDGTIAINGTATASAFFNVGRPYNSFTLKAGTYTFNGSGLSGVGCTLCKVVDGTGVFFKNANTAPVTFTIDEDTEYYFYIVVNNGTTVSNLTVSLQLERGSTATAYEPYKQNTYPLSDIELRGIPKLDASNNLYYDGDTYAPSGTVTRKYGIVDLGTLTWVSGTTAVSGKNRYLAALVNSKASDTSVEARAITSRYVQLGSGGTYTATNTGFTIASDGKIYIYDSARDTLSNADFKAAMSGVYLVYPLATSTTETTTPYSQTQIAGSTEEFVTNNVVPVGHNSSYSSAIKAIRASLYKAGGTTTLLTQTVIPCRTGSTGLAGTAIDTANESAKTATSYITDIDTKNGITVKAVNGTTTAGANTSNYIKLNSSGLDIYNKGVSVASYGSSARIGKQSDSHVDISPTSISMQTKAVSATSPITSFEVVQTSTTVKMTRLYNKKFNNGTLSYQETLYLGRIVSSWVSIKLKYKINNGNEITVEYTSFEDSDNPVDVWDNSVFGFTITINHLIDSRTAYWVTVGTGSNDISDSDTLTIIGIELTYVTDQPVVETTIGSYADTKDSGPLRVGNGVSTTALSNAMFLDWSGTARFNGDIVASCNPDSSGGLSLTHPTEDWDAFYYESTKSHVQIVPIMVGRVVTLYIHAHNDNSIAAGGNIFNADLSAKYIPQPFNVCASGFTQYSGTPICLMIWWDTAGNKWRCMARNMGTARTFGDFQGTITYISSHQYTNGDDIVDNCNGVTS